MAKNPRKHYITAKYDFAVDDTGAGAFPRTVTLANTSKLPDNAIVNEVCVYAPTAINSAGNAVTIAINAGGVNMTAAIPQANMSLNAVVPADVVDAGGKATSAADIKVIVGTEAVTAGVLDITIGYFLGT